MERINKLIICFLLGVGIGVVIVFSVKMLTPQTGYGKTLKSNVTITDYLSTQAIDQIITIIEKDGKQIKKITFSRSGIPELSITFADGREHNINIPEIKEGDK